MTKTAPVIQNVKPIVLSIATQFDAIGVKYQGLKNWKRTEPMTSNAMMIASAITPFAPRAFRSLGFKLHQRHEL